MNGKVMRDTMRGGEFWTGMAHVTLGVMCFAPGAVFVRLAAGIAPLEITLHRMFWAAACIFAYSIFVKHDAWMRGGREFAEFAGFGLIAAVHFGCFVASLSYTHVSHSLALCYTAPIFAAIFSALWLGERCGGRKAAGIVIAFAGIGILVGFEPGADAKVLFGDALALVSGIALGLYHTVGRMYREKYSMPKYNGNVYLFAAAYLFVALAFARTMWPMDFSSVYTVRSVSGVAGSTIFGTILGHLFVNSALRKVDTVIVSLITTQEVTTGVVFAYFILGEKTGATAVAGMLISLAGIAAVITDPSEIV